MATTGTQRFLGGSALPYIRTTTSGSSLSFRSRPHHINGAFWRKKTSTNEKLRLLSRSSSGGTFAALPFDLSPPPIDHDFLVSASLSVSVSLCHLLLSGSLRIRGKLKKKQMESDLESTICSSVLVCLCVYLCVCFGEFMYIAFMCYLFS